MAQVLISLVPTAIQDISDSARFLHQRICLSSPHVVGMVLVASAMLSPEVIAAPRDK